MDLVQRMREAYERRTRRSEELFKQAQRYTPFGVHSNYRYIEPYPLYCSRSQGSRIWDADGNEYVDFNMGFGALVTGHAHPLLVQAIKERAERGVMLGFEFEGTHELARLICERFGVDMVKFSSTGLEATQHAVRLARAYTGRRKVLKFEGCYHGSHDSLLVSVKPQRARAGHARKPRPVPASQGIHEGILANTLVAPFNDLEAVEEIMRRHGNDVAAIILEPIPMNMGFVPPKPGFLEGLRRLCDEYNSLLIFDEVKTCGKFYGGAQKRFGVRADLIALGKALAGGLPLSTLAGRREVMEAIVPGQVAHAGTFNANPLSVAAGLVTLRDILTEAAMERASRLGEELARGYQEILQDAKLQAQVQWMGISGNIFFTDKPVENWRDFLQCDVGRWWAYYLGMLSRGIIPEATGPDEQWTVSVVHGPEDISVALEAFKSVVSDLRRFELRLPVVEAI
jgi:glutamate-1-semialdehyde 2,1-aminomutase